MLCELKVENLALIESLHLIFEADDISGLVVMTGETGAGKSIMLRAIKLLTGGRAQTDWIRSGAAQCSVEALFEVNPEHTQFLDKLSLAGFGDDTSLIIKRIITEKGKSRLYINGSMATAKAVRELTSFLLNMAGQHDQQQLLQIPLHLDFLDTYGDLWAEREKFSACYVDYQEKHGTLQDLLQQESDKEARKDFLKYQLGEIYGAELTPGEDEELEMEKRRLKNSDTLIRLSRESRALLNTSVIDNLNLIRKNMEQAASLDGGAEGLAEELSSYCFQAEDLSSDLRKYSDELDNDPYRLEQVTERIDLIQGLKRKYGGTIEEIVEFSHRTEEELERLENLEVRLEELTDEVKTLELNLLEGASRLSRRRKSTALSLEKAMSQELDSLAFNRATTKVIWQPVKNTVADIGPSGWDRVEFHFSANQGEPAKPLAKVASGGELSRLMLAFKCLLARKDMVETVIFDEVDSGIGGEAAEAVARKIQELAGHHQVFVITHLPQIAARGTDHYLVEKRVNGGRTLSSMRLLSESEREDEVARMLAGDSASLQTHAWARELLMKSRHA